MNKYRQLSVLAQLHKRMAQLQLDLDKSSRSETLEFVLNFYEKHKDAYSKEIEK